MSENVEQPTGDSKDNTQGDASPSKGGNDTKPSSDKPGPASGQGESDHGNSGSDKK